MDKLLRITSGNKKTVFAQKGRMTVDPRYHPSLRIEYSYPFPLTQVYDLAYLQIIAFDK